MARGTIKVRLLGVFREAYGTSNEHVEIEGKVRLKDIIWRLADSSEDLKRALIDPELESPLPNAVIIVNGRDISALDGLETEVKSGDEIVLIPLIRCGVTR